MKYVVGYSHEGKFVVLYESENVRMAMLIANKYKATSTEEIKIKKGLDNQPEMCYNKYRN